MGQTADSVVVELEARLGNYTQDVQQGANAFDQSMKRMKSSATETEKSVGKSFGNIRVAQLEGMHVMTALSDSYAAGIPISRSLTMETGRLVEMIEMLSMGAKGGEGAFGSFLNLMKGPWGMAISGAIMLLTQLIFAHKGGEEGAKKQKIEDMDLAEALVKLGDATKGAITSEREHQKELLRTAEAVRRKAMETRDLTRAQLQQALNEAKAQHTRSQAPGQAGEMGALGAAAADNNVGRLEALLVENEKQVLAAEQRRSAALVPLMEQRAKELTDPSEAARGKAARAIDALRAAFDKLGDNSPAAVQRFVQAEARINAARDAEIKKIEEQDKAHRSHLRGNMMSTADAMALVREAGGTVTSGDRSNAKQKQLYDAWVAQGRPADNPVAPPGASAHNGAHGKHALDIAGMTAAEIDEAFTAAGVHLTKILKERGHIHVEWGPGGPRGPSDETLAKRAEAARLKQVRNDATFTNEADKLNEELLKLKQSGITSVSALADIEVQEVVAAKDRLDAMVKAALSEKRLTKPQADQLLALNAQVSEAKTRLIREKAANQITQDIYSVQEAALRTETEMAQLSGRLAETTEARKASALRLLDLSQQEERLALQALLANRDTKDVDRKKATDRLGSLDAIKGLATANINREFEDPGAAYMRSLNLSFSEVQQSVQSIEMQGLRGLQDGIADVITGARTLGDVFHNVANQIVGDLLRIVIQENLIKPLAKALGIGDSGGGLAGSLATLLGFGKSVAPWGAGSSPLDGFNPGSGPGLGGVDIPFAPGRAGGGPVVAGTLYRVNESGMEGFRPAGGGTIVPLGQMAQAQRSGGTTVVQHFTLDARYGITTPELLDHVNALADQAATRGAFGGAALAQRQMGRAASRRLA